VSLAQQAPEMTGQFQPNVIMINMDANPALRSNDFARLGYAARELKPQSLHLKSP